MKRRRKMSKISLEEIRTNKQTKQNKRERRINKQQHTVKSEKAPMHSRITILSFENRSEINKCLADS